MDCPLILIDNHGPQRKHLFYFDYISQLLFSGLELHLVIKSMQTRKTNMLSFPIYLLGIRVVDFFILFCIASLSQFIDKKKRKKKRVRCGSLQHALRQTPIDSPNFPAAVVHDSKLNKEVVLN